MTLRKHKIFEMLHRKINLATGSHKTCASLTTIGEFILLISNICVGTFTMCHICLFSFPHSCDFASGPPLSDK